MVSGGDGSSSAAPVRKVIRREEIVYDPFAFQDSQVSQNLEGMLDHDPLDMGLEITEGAGVAATIPPPALSPAVQQQLEAEAYTVGFEAGRIQGMQAAQQAMQAHLAAWEGMVSQFQQELIALRQSMAPRITTLVIQMVELVLRRACPCPPELLSTLIQEGLAWIPGLHGTYHIGISPHDAGALEGENFLSAYRQSGQPIQWEIYVDPALASGSVVLKTPDAEVVFDPVARWETLRQTLFPDPASAPEIPHHA